MGKPNIEKSKETKRRIDNDTKSNSKQQIVEKANECPEWLPDGWNVEIRTRKSGPNMGSEYKCYVDPLNEQKFYSKPEVLRYLETREDNSCTPRKEKKCSNMRSPSKKEDKFTDLNSQSKKEDECTGMHSPSKEEDSIKKVNKGKGENKCSNMHSPSKNEGSDTKTKKIKKEGKCTNMHSPSKNEDSIKKIEKSKEKDKCTDMDSPSNIVQKANGCPEWLPSNWSVEVRTRKSGPNKGSEYKCYIDPLNEHKFYSKPEVLRYLETRKENSCTPKKEKKCSNTESPSKKEDRYTDMHSPANKEDECTDMNSPIKAEGSIEKVKRSKKEDKCTNMHSPSKNEGKNDGSVIKLKKNRKEDTCNDMHSPSKNEDSLKKIEKRKEEDKDTGIHSPSNAVVEKSTAEDLPPGWIKEVKSRKNSNGGIKKDAFYTDPVSGYVFRSIKDVLRYLESGDTSKCAIKPSRIQIQDGDNSTPSPPAKRHKLKQYAPEQQIFVAKEPVDKSSLELPGVQTYSLKDGAANSPEIRKTPDPGNHSISKNEFKVGHRSSRRLAGVEPVQLADNVINEQTLQVPKRNLRKNKTSINTSDTLSEIVFEDQPQQLERDKIEDNKSEIHTDSKKSAKVKERHIPCRASKRLAGSEHELMNSISHEKAPKYRTRKSKEVKAELRQSEGGPVTKLTDHATINGESGNKRRKSPGIPPTADNKLEKTEDDDEKLEPLSFAFHYSWSDPSLEFAINTLTGVLPPVENSVDNGTSNVSKTDIQKPVSDINVTGSRNKQSTSVSGPATVSETCIEKRCFDNVTGRRDNQNTLLDNITGSRDRNPPVQSNKSKRKKEVKVPMRLSKRLAGLEPEVRPSERPLEYSAKKSRTEEPTAAAILSNGASDHLYAGEQTKPTLHAPDSLKTEFLIESSSKSEKSYDANITSKEQPLEKVEAENIGDDRSEPQLSLPFGESWSDPCIEFAFKTLTGALPVDSAAGILPFMTPNINGPRNNVLHGRVTSSINGEAHFNSNQSQNTKELNMDSQPSKLLLGQPELRASSTSGKNAAIFTTGEPHRDESNMLRSLGGEPIYIEAENATQLLHHSRTNINSRTHEEPLKKNGQVAVGEFVPTEQPPLQTELLNHDNTELQFSDSFMNSWSDPCLEFAFKTLTGVIPVEENLVIQGRNQEPAKHHEGTDGGSTLPDFGIGSSSFSQSDMLFNYDRGLKSMPGQQSSTSSPFPSFSLQNYPGADPQNHYSPFNNNFQRR